jgi:hypothetical protein
MPTGESVVQKTAPTTQPASAPTQPVTTYYRVGSGTIAVRDGQIVQEPSKAGYVYGTSGEVISTPTRVGEIINVSNRPEVGEPAVGTTPYKVTGVKDNVATLESTRPQIQTTQKYYTNQAAQPSGINVPDTYPPLTVTGNINPYTGTPYGVPYSQQYLDKLAYDQYWASLTPEQRGGLVASSVEAASRGAEISVSKERTAQDTALTEAKEYYSHIQNIQEKPTNIKDFWTRQNELAAVNEKRLSEGLGVLPISNVRATFATVPSTGEQLFVNFRDLIQGKSLEQRQADIDVLKIKDIAKDIRSGVDVGKLSPYEQFTGTVGRAFVTNPIVEYGLLAPSMFVGSSIIGKGIAQTGTGIAGTVSRAGTVALGAGAIGMTAVQAKAGYEQLKASGATEQELQTYLFSTGFTVTALGLTAIAGFQEGLTSQKVPIAQGQGIMSPDLLKTPSTQITTLKLTPYTTLLDISSTTGEAGKFLVSSTGKGVVTTPPKSPFLPNAEDVGWSIRNPLAFLSEQKIDTTSLGKLYPSSKIGYTLTEGQAKVSGVGTPEEQVALSGKLKVTQEGRVVYSGVIDELLKPITSETARIGDFIRSQQSFPKATQTTGGDIITAGKSIVEGVVKVGEDFTKAELITKGISGSQESPFPANVYTLSKGYADVFTPKVSIPSKIAEATKPISEAEMIKGGKQAVPSDALTIIDDIMKNFRVQTTEPSPVEVSVVPEKAPVIEKPVTPVRPNEPSGLQTITREPESIIREYDKVYNNLGEVTSGTNEAINKAVAGKLIGEQLTVGELYTTPRVPELLPITVGTTFTTTPQLTRTELGTLITDIQTVRVPELKPAVPYETTRIELQPLTTQMLITTPVTIQQTQTQQIIEQTQIPVTNFPIVPVVPTFLPTPIIQPTIPSFPLPRGTIQTLPNSSQPAPRKKRFFLPTTRRIARLTYEPDIISAGLSKFNLGKSTKPKYSKIKEFQYAGIPTTELMKKPLPFQKKFIKGVSL